MPPRYKSVIANTAGRQSAKEDYLQTVIRRSARLHAKDTPKTLASYPIPLPIEPPQDLSESLQTRQWKRSREETEDNHLRKRQRTAPQSVLRHTPVEGASQALSKHNLERLDGLPRLTQNREGFILDWMDSKSNTSARGRSRRTTHDTNRGLSRSQSRLSTSTVTDLTQETASQRSQRTSCSNANYRFIVLKSARIYIEHRPPPDEIEKQIDAIIGSEIPADRKERLTCLTRALCDDFAKILRGAAGEDDSIELLYQALASMDSRKMLVLTRKADWRPSLKPYVRPSWDLSFVNEPQHELANSAIPHSTVSPIIPRKRSLTDANYLSLCHSSESAATGGRYTIDRAPENEAMLPPPPPSELDKDNSPIKTPRPDVSVGILNDVVVEQLQSQSLNDTEAQDLLDDLQRQLMDRKQRKQPEPVLCSEPTQRELQLRFPFLVVEGKSYATGKHIFEAENQAAVSGACALKIQHDLNELVDLASQEPGNGREVGPLVFSICTQGPFLELWAHYDSAENNVRMFHMVPVLSCRAPIQKEVLQWLMAVDNVMSWGTGDFLNGVVERLGKVAKRARRADGGGT